MKLLLATATLAGLAAADFQIFIGQTNDPVGGGSGQNAVLYRMEDQAGCDNQASSNIVIRADSSSLGASCDGCDLDKAPNDMEITRFELFDKPGNSGNRGVTVQEYGSLTAFLEEDGVYGLNARDPDVEGSERRIGRCERVTGEELQCPRGLTTDFLSAILNCFGETEPIDLKE